MVASEWSGKNLPELQTSLNDIVAKSRLPTVSVVEEDGRWKALSLRAGRSVTGPYRTLKLSPYSYSDAKVTTMDAAKKMGESFHRFDDTRWLECLSNPDNFGEERADLERRLRRQKEQLPDSFKLTNLDISGVSMSEFSPDDGWIHEYVELMDKADSNVLLAIPPGDAQTAENVLRYQLSAMTENAKLANPMYVAGYIPTMSPDQCTSLIDAYVSAGINTLIYDFRGRRITESSLVHLAATTAESQTPIYVHGFQVSPHKMAKPYYTLYDLVMARVGVQSISNLRRTGGGKKNSHEKIFMKRRVKCIHGYMMPSLDEIFQPKAGRFQCPHCDLSLIEAAVRDDSPNKITQRSIQQNVEISSKELETMRTRIKENSFGQHFNNKPGLDPIADQLIRFEKAVERERTKMREESVK